MTTYKTGNPVGSTSVRDLYDNAENLDTAVNTAEPTWEDRFGRTRLSMRGMAEAAGDATIAIEAAQQSVDAAGRSEFSRRAAELSADLAAADADRAQGAADLAQASSSTVWRETLIDLQSVTSPPVNTPGVVTNDPDPDNNGYYVWDGGEWIWSGLQPASAGRVESIDNRLNDVDGNAREAVDLVFPQIFSKDFAWAVVDQNGIPIVGVRRSGTAYALTDEMPGMPMLSAYAWAIVDANDVVLLGVKWNGEVTAYGSAEGASQLYVDGPGGQRQIWALIGGAPHQLTDAGDNVSPSLSAGRVRYISRSGGMTQQEMDLPAYGERAAYIDTIAHIVGSGQSLVMGAGAALTTTQPPCANRLLTIADGIRLTDQDGVLDSGAVAPFIPLTSKSTEVPLVQLCGQLGRLGRLASGLGLLASVHGRGGYSIAQLGDGSQFYANSMTAVTQAAAYCADQSLAYWVPCVDWIQGEADQAGAEGAYYAALDDLQADYDTDIRAVTGQSRPVVLLVDQISNWTAYGSTESHVPLEQLQIALDHPDRFICAGPKYWLPTNEDGVHLPAASSMRLGCMHARAALAILEGRQWLPTHCVNAVHAGRQITLTFHTPSGPLVVDTEAVSDPGNWGLRWVDDDDSAEIASVQLIGANQVLVTLDVEPTGANGFIGIADVGAADAHGGPTTGARSNLRDSNPDFDAYGQPIYNWACHQRVSIT